MVLTYRRFGKKISVPSSRASQRAQELLDFLKLQDGKDRSSRNVGKYKSTRRPEGLRIQFSVLSVEFIQRVLPFIFKVIFTKRVYMSFQIYVF